MQAKKRTLIMATALAIVALLGGALLARASGVSDWSVFMVAPQTGQVTCAEGPLTIESSVIGLNTSTVLIHCGAATPWPTPKVVYPPTPLGAKGRPVVAPTSTLNR